MPTALETMLNDVNATRPILEQIANKWSVLILTVVCSQPARFNAIKRRLERNGLVSRHVIASSPVAVEYAITPLGKTLQTPFTTLIAWANQHGPELLRMLRVPMTTAARANPAAAGTSHLRSDVNDARWRRTRRPPVAAVAAPSANGLGSPVVNGPTAVVLRAAHFDVGSGNKVRY